MLAPVQWNSVPPLFSIPRGGGGGGGGGGVFVGCQCLVVTRHFGAVQ